MPVPGGIKNHGLYLQGVPGQGRLHDSVNEELSGESLYEDMDKLMGCGHAIRDNVMDASFQPDFEEEQWERVSGGSVTSTVAGRSSAPADDLPETSFAG